jgi:hypothetical protein
MEPSPLVIVFDFDIFDKILPFTDKTIGRLFLPVKG